MSKGPHPRILKNVLSVIDVACNSQDCTKYHFAMTPAKLYICEMVSVPCPHSQKRIAGGCHRSPLRSQFGSYRPSSFCPIERFTCNPLADYAVDPLSVDWASHEDE